MKRRPRLTATMLAQLAAVASADAQARIDPREFDDLTDRHRPPRTLTAADFDEAAHLSTLSAHLERRARRARWSGPIWGAFNTRNESEGE